MPDRRYPNRKAYAKRLAVLRYLSYHSVTQKAKRRIAEERKTVECYNARYGDVSRFEEIYYRRLRERDGK